MEFLKIFLTCVAAAIIYGILHDHVTAHICVEYFFVAHPTILPLTSPTLLAFQWGVLATWWVGAALGIGLGFAARRGKRVVLGARDLRRPVVTLLLVMAGAALVSGISGFVLAKTNTISLSGWLASAIPEARHARFIADWWAHSASYLVGIIGGVVLCVRTYFKRNVLTAGIADKAVC